jgi:hypothetical protein
MKKALLTLLVIAGTSILLPVNTDASPFTPAGPYAPYAPSAPSAYGVTSQKKSGGFHLPKLHITLPHWFGKSS